MYYQSSFVYPIQCLGWRKKSHHSLKHINQVIPRLSCSLFVLFGFFCLFVCLFVFWMLADYGFCTCPTVGHDLDISHFKGKVNVHWQEINLIWRKYMEHSKFCLSLAVSEISTPGTKKSHCNFLRHYKCERCQTLHDGTGGVMVVAFSSLAKTLGECSSIHLPLFRPHPPFCAHFFVLFWC